MKRLWMVLTSEVYMIPVMAQSKPENTAVTVRWP